MVQGVVGQEAPPQTRLSHAQAELEVHLLRAAFSEGVQALLENPAYFQKTAWVEEGAQVYQVSLVEGGPAVPGVQENFHYSGWAKVELPLQEKILQW